MQKIFGIIGWIGTILVFGAVAVRLAVRYEGISADWNQYATYAAWAGLVAVLVYMAGQWRDVAKFYEGRGARYGTLSIISIVVFAAILVAINYLGARQNKRWDLTANQIYSLSDQTTKILQELKEPVQITVFERTDRQAPLRAQLNEYGYQTTQLKTRFIDPDREPEATANAKVEVVPTLLIEYKDRSQRINTSNEQELTNALIKVTTGAARKVYFLQGHGEKDPASSDRAGLSAIAEQMKQDNYEFDQLVLVQTKTIPEDATVVVIAGPVTDLFATEIEALNTFVAKGGKVMVLVDPLVKGPAQPLLLQFLADWGISAGTESVKDEIGGARVGANDSVTVAAEYPPHAITAGFGLYTLFPLARQVAPIEGGSNGRTAQPLVKTSSENKAGAATLGAAVSAPATVTPAVSGNATPPAPDAPKPETRIVAIGDSDFATNAAVGFQGNRDFFMNAMNWLSQQENLIAIRPRQPQDHRLTMTEDQTSLVVILSLFILPGLVFASGVYSWWKRR